MADEIRSTLHIKPGVAAPKRNRVRRTGAKSRHDLSVERLVEGIREGDRAVLAKAITMIESSHPDDRKTAEQIIGKCHPAEGHSIRVGVTGAPGAGKSSLIEVLGKHLIRDRGQKVAVLAIDPSSQLSGGSILGDKTRMPFLLSSEMAFLRSSPSRGGHGGVGQRTREAIQLCEAAGYQNILVETVGVGQSDCAVRNMVDFFLLVILPGGGDELQGIKRGVMELADLVAVNKADGNQVALAEQARADAINALLLMRARASGWVPRAIACSAKTDFGVPGLWSCVLDYASLTRANGWFEQARREQARHSIHEDLHQELIRAFSVDPILQRRMAALEQECAAGKTTTRGAVRELLGLFAATIAGNREN